MYSYFKRRTRAFATLSAIYKYYQQQILARDFLLYHKNNTNHLRIDLTEYVHYIILYPTTMPVLLFLVLQKSVNEVVASIFKRNFLIKYVQNTNVAVV